MTESDRELLRRSASGDNRAFEAFLQRHQASAFRLIQTLASDPADVEDALQETFISAWRAAGTFRGSGGARAWLLTIARNAVHRQHRRRVGEPSEFISLDDLGRQAGWGIERPADRLLASLEDRRILDSALRQLSPEDREVLILRDLEGFSGEEVAELIGLTLPATKSRLHRARLRLTAALKEELDARA